MNILILTERPKVRNRRNALKPVLHTVHTRSRDGQSLLLWFEAGSMADREDGSDPKTVAPLEGSYASQCCVRVMRPLHLCTGLEADKPAVEIAIQESAVILWRGAEP